MVAGPDPLGDALERDTPHLLEALRLVLRLYGRYVTTEDYAAILAVLTAE